MCLVHRDGVTKYKREANQCAIENPDFNVTTTCGTKAMPAVPLDMFNITRVKQEWNKTRGD